MRRSTFYLLPKVICLYVVLTVLTNAANAATGDLYAAAGNDIQQFNNQTGALVGNVTTSWIGGNSYMAWVQIHGSTNLTLAVAGLQSSQNQTEMAAPQAWLSAPCPNRCHH